VIARRRRLPIGTRVGQCRVQQKYCPIGLPAGRLKVAEVPHGARTAQWRKAAPLIAVRKSCSPSCKKSQTPCKVPRWPRPPTGEPRIAFFRPPPNTPSKASVPPDTENSVTYVSGTMCYLCLRPLTVRSQQRFHIERLRCLFPPTCLRRCSYKSRGLFP
jgi:hypothetical protein